MSFSLFLTCTAAFFLLALLVKADEVVEHVVVVEDCKSVLKPKVFIFTFFEDEGQTWIQNSMLPGSIGSLYAQNITVLGLHSAFPNASCTAEADVCIITTGEAEINAATSVSALLSSPEFDLTETYLFTTGIAGVNPVGGTLGDVGFIKYAVQGSLQYEIDARELPDNFTTGYFPQSLFGESSPTEYPTDIYGTEVYEVNEALRDIAVKIALTVALNDSSTAMAYRSNYADSMYAATATQSPSIKSCDVVTSDVFYSGTLLDESFENFTKLITNGSGIYCFSAQEDNGALEAMLRGAINKLIDFSRILVMRSASDFQRPFPGQSDLQNLLFDDQGGFPIALSNMYFTGVEIVQTILSHWDTGMNFAHGINATNYVGDIIGRLGGTPDFGPGPAAALTSVTARDLNHVETPKGRKLGRRSRKIDDHEFSMYMTLSREYRIRNRTSTM